MSKPIQFVSVENVCKAADLMHAESGDMLMVLVGGGLIDACPDLVADLQEIGVPFFGGVFPEILLGDEVRSDQCLVIPVRTVGSAHILLAPFSAEKVNDLPDHLDLVATSGRTDLSALVFVSGLTLDISEFTRNLYRKYGVEIRYAGSGTGTFELNPAIPSVFSSDGLFSNAAMIVFLNEEVGLGARHGWTRCHGPYVATQTENRTVREINWRPAFEVYAEAILAITGEELTAENFRHFAALHPIGLTKDGNEDLVREPFRLDGTSIAFSAEVLSQSPFYILEAKLESLRTAATEASQLASIEAPRFSLVFECLSRAGYLGKEELAADMKRVEQACVSEEDVPHIGLISLGEIASNKRGMLEFMNQTVVVTNIGKHVS